MGSWSSFWGPICSECLPPPLSSPKTAFIKIKFRFLHHSYPWLWEPKQSAQGRFLTDWAWEQFAQSVVKDGL